MRYECARYYKVMLIAVLIALSVVNIRRAIMNLSERPTRERAREIERTVPQMGDAQETRTVAQIARDASDEVAAGLKTGAAQPLRVAMALLDKLIAGEYEKGGDEEGEPSAKAKPKAKAKARKPRACKPRR